MSPERLTELQSQGAGVGIRGMRERHLRGDLVIESGTKVCATLPLTTSPSPRKSNTQEVVTQCR
jgi:signal transduction histidine kinase